MIDNPFEEEKSNKSFENGYWNCVINFPLQF